MTVPLKLPPHSRDSEMMVLGCMLTSTNSLNIGADHLFENDFYFSEHRTLFRVLRSAYKMNKPADVHLASEELKRQGLLQSVGGIAYVSDLAQFSGTGAYIEEYIEIVRNRAILRRMIEAAKVVEKGAMEEPQDVAEALDDAQAQFFRISQRARSDTGVLVKDLLSGMRSTSQLPYLKELEIRQEKYLNRDKDDPGITGLATHFIDLDRMLNGFGNSNLIILAARPAMGKTALAINIAENICFKTPKPVAVFSLEMTSEQLLHRMVCSQSEVESDKIRTGSISGGEYQRIVRAAHEMQKHSMLLDDQPGLKISDLRARARRMKETHDVGLIIIDYLQLITGSGNTRSFENRQNEISEISRMLKTLARELDVPVLCLSQLSRKVEERPGHRPVMSDLRESGSIEQDADVVLFLLRRDYYNPDDKPGAAELIVAKNRHGGTGVVQLTYRKPIAQFANFSQEGQSEGGKDN